MAHPTNAYSSLAVNVVVGALQAAVAPSSESGVARVPSKRYGGSVDVNQLAVASRPCSNAHTTATDDVTEICFQRVAPGQ